MPKYHLPLCATDNTFQQGVDIFRQNVFVDRNFTVELEIKDTTDAARPALYLVLHLEIDSEIRLRTKFYDKRDDFNFPIASFPSLCNNVLAAHVYGVYIS